MSPSEPSVPSAPAYEIVHSMKLSGRSMFGLFLLILVGFSVAHIYALLFILESSLRFVLAMGVVLAIVAAALVVRWRDTRRWQTIDWMEFKPARTRTVAAIGGSGI